MASGGYERAIKSLERVEGRAAGTLLAQQAQTRPGLRLLEDGRARPGAVHAGPLHQAAIRRARHWTTRSTCAASSTSTTTWASSATSRQDLSERDQQASRDAYQSFKQLVDQFPQSSYADDAKTAHGLHRQCAGRVRSARGALLLSAAAPTWPRSTARSRRCWSSSRRRPLEEALYIMAQSYDRLGLEQLRDDADRVLQEELPEQHLPDRGSARARNAPGGSSGERARAQCAAARAASQASASSSPAHRPSSAARRRASGGRSPSAPSAGRKPPAGRGRSRCGSGARRPASATPRPRRRSSR